MVVSDTISEKPRGRSNTTGANPPITPIYTGADGATLDAPLTHTISTVSQRAAKHPDLSFPFLTTQTSAGVSSIYRTETAQGYIPASELDVEQGLHPILSASTRHSIASTFNGGESAQARNFKNELADKKLVTWTPGDKENPHNWGKGLRWGES